jgi:glutathione synthase/RimK-type ligase-like ATP-grasp enzyme
LKVVENRAYVIEVNDNPSIDAGCEDLLLKDELYRLIMNEFMIRVEKLKERKLL